MEMPSSSSFYLEFFDLVSDRVIDAVRHLTCIFRQRGRTKRSCGRRFPEPLESRRLLAADVFAGSADSYVLASDAPSAIPTGRGVLANDFNSHQETLAAVLVDDAGQGTLDLRADGSFSYTPGPGFLGTDAFTYQVSYANKVSDDIEVELRVTAEPVVVSEFMASAGRDLLDEDGDSSDWIELSNLTSTPINLNGWHLTDNQSELSKWQLPNVVVPAHGFLMVFASGKDRTGPLDELHTNFRLSAAGEYLGLVRPDMIVADEFAPEFPQQHRGVSYGRAMSAQSADLLRGADSFSYVVPTAADAELGDSWIREGI